MTRTEQLHYLAKCRIGLELEGSNLAHWPRPIQPSVRWFPYLTQPVRVLGWIFFDPDGKEMWREAAHFKIDLCNGDQLSLDLSKLRIENDITVADLFTTSGIDWRIYGF
jgi:hypothetical protein